MRWGGGGMQARNPEGFKTGQTTSTFFVIEPAGALIGHKNGLWQAPWAADGNIAAEKGESLGPVPSSENIVATTDRLIYETDVNRSGRIFSQLRLCDRPGTVLATADLPARLMPQGLAVAGDHIAAACADGSIALLATR